MVSSEQKTTMADQLGWSFGADGFPDLGTDFLNTNSFDNHNLEDIDGKLNFFCQFVFNLFTFTAI